MEGAAPDVSLGPLAIRFHPAAVRWRVIVVSSWSRRLLQNPKTMELAIFIRMVLQNSSKTF